MVLLHPVWHPKGNNKSTLILMDLSALDFPKKEVTATGGDFTWRKMLAVAYWGWLECSGEFSTVTLFEIIVPTSAE